MKRHREDPVLEDEESKPGNGEPRDEEPTGLEAVESPAEQEIDALRRECGELKDQLLRRRADFENYRKRVERDKELAALEAKAQVLSGLLPTLDNLERALATPPTADRTLREGVELTLRNLVSFLEAQGVVAKDPTGETFDPQIHQALMHEPVPGQADGTIVEAFRKAYFLKDRLLRPALVKVAKGVDADESPEETH